MVDEKLETYKLAKTLAEDGDDIAFYMLMIEYLKLPPETRLALGLARGRRKYFIIRK